MDFALILISALAKPGANSAAVAKTPSASLVVQLAISPEFMSDWAV
jgi:hypothetical protein